MAPDQLFISADIAVMAVSRFKSIAVDDVEAKRVTGTRAGNPGERITTHQRIMNSAILRWLYIGEDENSNGSRPYNRLLRAMDRSRALYS